MTNEQHNKHCKAIVNDLIAYADGYMYRCPECGEILQFPEDVGDKYRCPECETVAEVEDFEQLCLWDYFDDMLDIKYTVDNNKTYFACRIMIACGGPNIYIDTLDRQVQLYWWNESGKAWLPSSVCDAIDEFAEELYNC